MAESFLTAFIWSGSTLILISLSFLFRLPERISSRSCSSKIRSTGSFCNFLQHYSGAYAFQPLHDFADFSLGTHAATIFLSFWMIIFGSVFLLGTGRFFSFSNATCSFMPHLALKRQSSTEWPIPEKPSKWNTFSSTVRKILHILGPAPPAEYDGCLTGCESRPVTPRLNHRPKAT